MENILYKLYNLELLEIRNKNVKKEEFLKRIEPFNKVKNLDEAKKLAEKILPTKNEITSFSITDVTCTIVNRKNLFRLTIETDTEFFCYDFH